MDGRMGPVSGILGIDSGTDDSARGYFQSVAAFKIRRI